MKHIFTVIILLFTISTKAQIGIGTSTPDASARLQVDANASTNAKGFLPPRVTATERAGVVSPATGLIVYQTDGTKGFYYYDGTAWNLLTINTSTVPYTGATKSVNLGAYDLTVNGITLGKGAGNVSTNTASGYQALNSNTTGSSNTANGSQALYANTTGTGNTAIGRSALQTASTGVDNTALGYNALIGNTTGSNNVGIGVVAGANTTTGGYNISIGKQAMQQNTTGSSNIAVGAGSIDQITTGSNNAVLGAFAGRYYGTGMASNYTTTLTSSILLGYDTRPLADNGSNEIVIGTSAIGNGSNTTTIGGSSTSDTYLKGNVHVSNAIKISGGTPGAGKVLTSDANGLASWTTPTAYVPYSGATGAVDLGAYDLTVNGLTVGKGAGNISSNTASGVQALNSNTTGAGNIASGYQALYSNTTGSYNTASGFQSLYSNTTGGINTASGHKALYSNINGLFNTASGLEVLYSNTTGSYNTASGTYALYYNTTGNQNTALGYSAGINATTGSNNTLLGYDAQASSATVSNEITLGNTSITTLRCNAQNITSLSDRRDKTDIIPIVEGLAFLKQLNPVSFTWNTRDKAKVGIKSAGFIAQELLALQKQSNIGDNLDLVSEDNPEKLEARYGNLLPVIVKAIQEESAEKDKEIKALKERLDALEKQITEMLNK